MEYKYVKAVVDEYGLEMTANMIAILKAHGSQNLVNEFSQKVVEDMNLIMLEIHLPSYGYYSSEGRAPGRFPPLNSIKKWMVSRNIDLAALYPIARKIASIGTKQQANHFLQEFKLTPEFESDVLKAYTLDIKDALNKYVNKINNEN